MMVAADGQVLARFTGTNHEWQPLAKISPYVVQALVATEDRRFFHHAGIAEPAPRRAHGHRAAHHGHSHGGGHGHHGHGRGPRRGWTLFRIVLG